MRRQAPLLLVLLLAAGLVGTGCGQDAPKSAPVLTPEGGPEVWLVSFGDRKVSTVAAVREITGLGLAEAKALVERAPVLVKRAADAAEALALEQRLAAAGATVEVRGAATPR